MAVDENEQDAHSPQDARLTSLDQRLDRAKREEALRAGTKPSEESQRLIRSVGMRILSDLIGLPFGAGLIGWLLDRWAGTTPWVMLAMLFLGFGLAVRSVMRAANQRPGEGSGK
ncbi:MAG: AtpZ/AtpI family protein [Sphingomonas sp.]|uniref:AtpZ/AtpI family protein n=1 Tax=Sphingomonas sp. TaxID=28214 RepID=UPI0017DE1C01|nr:AtpZ/AtpI family protein [Sphingomonas sp.]MBA3667184.1 AtpZ/AtpI family protein [Sphingomonas sp.]